MQMELVLPGGHENLMTLLASDKNSGATTLGFCNFAWQVLPGPSTAAAALKCMLDLKSARKPESIVHFFHFPTAPFQHSKYHPCPITSPAPCTSQSHSIFLTLLQHPKGHRISQYWQWVLAASDCHSGSR